MNNNRLRAVFHAYCSYGHNFALDEISAYNFSKFCKDSGFMIYPTGKRIPPSDFDLVFSQIRRSKKERRVGYTQFVSALHSIALRIGVESEELFEFACNNCERALADEKQGDQGSRSSTENSAFYKFAVAKLTAEYMGKKFRENAADKVKTLAERLGDSEHRAEIRDQMRMDDEIRRVGYERLKMKQEANMAAAVEEAKCDDGSGDGAGVAEVPKPLSSEGRVTVTHRARPRAQSIANLTVMVPDGDASPSAGSPTASNPASPLGAKQDWPGSANSLLDVYEQPEALPSPVVTRSSSAVPSPLSTSPVSAREVKAGRRASRSHSVAPGSSHATVAAAAAAIHARGRRSSVAPNGTTSLPGSVHNSPANSRANSRSPSPVSRMERRRVSVPGGSPQGVASPTRRPSMPARSSSSRDLGSNARGGFVTNRSQAAEIAAAAVDWPSQRRRRNLAEEDLVIIDEGPLDDLRGIFYFYTKNALHMDQHQWCRFITDCNIFDRRRLTKNDALIIFTSNRQREERRISFDEFADCVRAVADRKDMRQEIVLEWMISQVNIRREARASRTSSFREGDLLSSDVDSAAHVRIIDDAESSDGDDSGEGTDDEYGEAAAFESYRHGITNLDLRSVFGIYSSGMGMDSTQFSKALDDCCLMDKKFGKHDADLIFAKFRGNRNRRITYEQFTHLLVEVGKKKDLEPEVVAQWMVSQAAGLGFSSSHTVRPAKSQVTDLYGGKYGHRFPSVA